MDSAKKGGFTAVERSSERKKRCRANERERQRVQEVTTMFEELREIVPRVATEPQLARIEILQRASGYIRYLTDVLDADSSTCPPSDVSPRCLRHTYLETSRTPLHLLSQKNAEYNKRARARSECTKAGFRRLKASLPLSGDEPDLSRLEILRRAMEYIGFLTEVLNEDVNPDIADSSKTDDRVRDMCTQGSSSMSNSTEAPSCVRLCILSAGLDCAQDSVSRHLDGRTVLAQSGDASAAIPSDITSQASSDLSVEVDSDYGSLLFSPASLDWLTSFEDTLPSNRISRSPTQSSHSAVLSSCSQFSKLSTLHKSNRNHPYACPSRFAHRTSTPNNWSDPGQ